MVIQQVAQMFRHFMGSLSSLELQTLCIIIHFSYIGKLSPFFETKEFQQIDTRFIVRKYKTNNCLDISPLSHS